MLLFRVPSRRRRSTEAPSKHAQRKGNKLARTGRESSPGPFADPRPRDKTPAVPGAAKKTKRICGTYRSRTEVANSLCASLRSRNAHTTQNARGQKSPTHFVRACAVETHFDIKQEHESAANTTQNARGQKSPTHFVRACAVETHFDIKQEHESAANTTQNGQSGHLNLAPRPFLLP